MSNPVLVIDLLKMDLMLLNARFTEPVVRPRANSWSTNVFTSALVYSLIGLSSQILMNCLIVRWADRSADEVIVAPRHFYQIP